MKAAYLPSYTSPYRLTGLFTGHFALHHQQDTYPSNFFLRFSRIRVDLLSYDTKPTDTQDQYDWMSKKNWAGTAAADAVASSLYFKSHFLAKWLNHLKLNQMSMIKCIQVIK